MSGSIFETGDSNGRSTGVCRTCSDDPYGDATAEFYDLLATAMWDELGPALPHMLSGLEPATGPILDLGAGTGAGTIHLHAAFPDASIVAVEPSKAMRTALNVRLANNASRPAQGGHRDAVRVRGCRPAGSPRWVCGVRRDRPFRRTRSARGCGAWSAGCLAPGAPALIGVLPPTRPEPVPPTLYRSLPVGALVYEGWMQGEPVDDRRMLWTMTYRVCFDDDVVYEQQALSMWHTCGPDDVAAEAAACGLVDERPGPDHVVLRRRGRLS